MSQSNSLSKQLQVFLRLQSVLLPMCGDDKEKFLVALLVPSDLLVDRCGQGECSFGGVVGGGKVLECVSSKSVLRLLLPVIKEKESAGDLDQVEEEHGPGADEVTWNRRKGEGMKLRLVDIHVWEVGKGSDSER